MSQAELARRAVAPHRRQRHLRLQTRLDPSSSRSHTILSSLDQSYHDLDLKSWSSFLGPPLRSGVFVWSKASGKPEPRCKQRLPTPLSPASP